MDFLTTARLLMKIQADHPDMAYEFDQIGQYQEITIRLPVDPDVPQLFDDAHALFAVETTP